jgi:hypothetical protein
MNQATMVHWTSTVFNLHATKQLDPFFLHLHLVDGHWPTLFLNCLWQPLTPTTSYQRICLIILYFVVLLDLAKEWEKSFRVSGGQLTQSNFSLAKHWAFWKTKFLLCFFNFFLKDNRMKSEEFSFENNFLLVLYVRWQLMSRAFRPK